MMSQAEEERWIEEGRRAREAAERGEGGPPANLPSMPGAGYSGAIIYRRRPDFRPWDEAPPEENEGRSADSA